MAIATAICGSISIAPASIAEAASKHPSRLIFWVQCDRIVGMSDAELDQWKARGVDGFVCMGQRLRGLGGTQDFTGDPNASLAGEQYALQRSLRDTRIVERTAARGMKLYLGFKLANYFNRATPLVEWFDDAGWYERVIPKVWDLASAARALGFAGIAMDQELYQQRGGAQSATWAWDYPGNTHPEDAVRQQVTKRGQEMMSTILAGFPGVEIIFHDFPLPDSWTDRVYQTLAKQREPFDELVQLDFWDGMTSIEGYAALRYANSVFHKATHLNAPWNEALRYDSNRFFALLSRRLSNWDYASARFHWTPFSWLDAGPSSSGFDDQRPPPYVAQQLQAFRRWTTGGEFANFVYGGLREEDYERYEDAMRAASRNGEVDRQNPEVEIASAARRSRPPSRVTGIARDNLGIRVVRWTDDRGGAGVAKMTWNAEAKRMRWTFPARALTQGAGQVRVTAEDIKGRTASRVLSW